MKRKYYRILSGLLSFTMIFSEIGSMTAMTALSRETGTSLQTGQENILSISAKLRKGSKRYSAAAASR